jgi:hypothetical protein
MKSTFRRRARHAFLTATVSILPSVFGLVNGGAIRCPARAAALPTGQSPHAAAYQAYDHYIQLTESRMPGEIASGGAFLRVDSLAPAEREAGYAALRGGELRIEPLTTFNHGQQIACPGCMIHHWAGVIFISGVTLDQTLRLMQDYDHQAEIYAPEVVRAKILSHTGDDFRVFMRFRQTKIITVVLDTEHEVRYQRLDSMRAASRSISTRVQEVENAGTSNEHDLPEGEDNGYLWRINSYWRFLERDGGVYVQCESVSLTRDIPVGLGWLAAPFVESIPRESLSFMLIATRKQFKSLPHNDINRIVSDSRSETDASNGITIFPPGRGSAEHQLSNAEAMDLSRQTQDRENRRRPSPHSRA